jgi:predicted dehydrogenase
MAKKRKKLTVALFGAGAIAQRRHTLEYANRDDVEMIALVDPNMERAKQVADHFNIPNIFPDYKAALKLKPDLVSVCSPNAFHARQTIDSLRAGAHVLVEKPMGISVPDMRAMIKTSKDTKRQIMVAHNQRFNASHRHGYELYRSGVMGKALAFRISFAHKGPEFWSVDGADCQFFKKDQAVLGSLADLGVHKLDLVRWILGQEFVEACGMIATMEKKKCEVEDTAVSILRTEKGIMGQMFAAWIRKGGDENATVFFCEKGVIRLEDHPEFPVIVEKANGEQTFVKMRKIQTNEPGQQYGSGVIDAFVGAIQAGKTVPITGADGANSAAAVLACVESAKTGKRTKVARF